MIYGGNDTTELIMLFIKYYADYRQQNVTYYVVKTDKIS